MSRGHALRNLWLTICLTVLVFTAGATSAAVGRDAAIDPGQRVNGMLVVQGEKRDADAWLFDSICDPVVLRPGRRTRSCGQLPPVRRIFVGHGIFAPSDQLDSAWKSTRWELWVDGRRVSLLRFGHSDRPLIEGGKDVVLREWAIILVGAEGRHSIRYRTHSPRGVGDTTWRFVVTPS